MTVLQQRVNFCLRGKTLLERAWMTRVIKVIDFWPQDQHHRRGWVIVKQETKKKRNETSRNETKRNETIHNRNETKPKQSSINKKTKQTLTKRFFSHATTKVVAKLYSYYLFFYLPGLNYVVFFKRHFKTIKSTPSGRA